jgi:hypothetical protein
VNELPRGGHDAGEIVIVGCGKTATDACVWLLRAGVAPDAIRWIRPRDPWMLDRAVVQPNPAVFQAMVADTLEAAAAADSPDDLFLRLEEAGVMLRIDRAVTPTMAKAPTLGRWELELLRSIEKVTRLGHIREVRRGRIDLEEGSVATAEDALIVHCAAPGLRYRPLTPIWDAGAITLQPVRAGFPCFAAALIGYVEATRDDDAEKHRICRPSPYPDTPADWALMQAVGGRAAQAFGAEPDVRAWANGVALNPARIAPERAADPDVTSAVTRVRAGFGAGLAGLARLAGMG